MKHKYNDFILTNNPLVFACLSGSYCLDYRPEAGHREILVAARDMVYMGHRLYNHPLSGSVKPNETPYRSLVLSREPCGFDGYQAEIIANAVMVFDGFGPLKGSLPQTLLQDFQRMDYALLCSGIGLDAAAGMGNVK